MSKGVHLKPGYRRAAAGVVGCLLVGGALGTTPHHGGAVAMTAPEMPSAASRAALFWEPSFSEGQTTAGHRASAHIMSTRLLRPAANDERRMASVQTYTVKEGDTLTAIAEAYETDMATLESLNAEIDVDWLQPGQPIQVVRAFHGLTYVVQEGDTLESVASLHGIAAEEIHYANGLQLDAGLREGEVLFLPGARPRSRMVVSRGSQTRTEQRPVATATDVKPPEVVTAKTAPASALAAAPPPPAPPAVDGTWIWPIVGGEHSSEFGWRGDIGDFHEGIDIAVPAGTPAVASKGGVVEVAGWEGGYGLCVIIDHGDGTKSRYAHASALLVAIGDAVRQGQPVIRVGSTGHSTGNHLHFEVIVNGQPQDPRGYLP